MTRTNRECITFAVLVHYFFICLGWRGPGRATGIMAEWLRRQTRNLVGSALVGSNPADVAQLFSFSRSVPVVSRPRPLNASGIMAEWLRRQTRNLVGSALVGSNPADVAQLFFLLPPVSETCV